MYNISVRREKRLLMLKQRKKSILKEISLYKKTPNALIIHEQIELMRVNDSIEILNDLINEK